MFFRSICIEKKKKQSDIDLAQINEDVEDNIEPAGKPEESPSRDLTDVLSKSALSDNTANAAKKKKAPPKSKVNQNDFILFHNDNFKVNREN